MVAGTTRREAGEVLIYDDVELPPGRMADKLRTKQ